MKLTENQQSVLQWMRRHPDKMYSADELACSLALLQSLQRKGLVSGVYGATAIVGARRGMAWKLTTEGKEVQ